MRRERNIAPAPSRPQTVEDETTRLELKVDDDIVVANEFELGCIECRVEGDIDRTRLVYYELSKCVEVLCMDTLNTHDDNKGKSQ